MKCRMPAGRGLRSLLPTPPAELAKHANPLQPSTVQGRVGLILPRIVENTGCALE
ncbi:hypothetical protein M2375_002881 [Comamonas sp. BIGb0152]|nr:hypothetical protein [Comamonas sp. BIGb0152]